MDWGSRPPFFDMSHSPFLFSFFFHCSSLFFKERFYLFLERGEGKEKEWERNINVWQMEWVVASHTPQVGDLACNPGVCPEWESNRWPFGLQAGPQSTEPHQPGRSLQSQCIRGKYLYACVFLFWGVFSEILYFISPISFASNDWEGRDVLLV